MHAKCIASRPPPAFPAAVAQLPRPVLEGDPKLDGNAHPVGNYDIEGVAIGYKWYDRTGRTPLFPFGHGLSYTTFTLNGLTATPAGKTLAAGFTVRNTGPVAGKAVPQLYVAGAGWEAPKRLGAFEKVALAPGATRDVTLTIDPRLLATSVTAIVQTVPVRLAAATLDKPGR